MLINGMMFFVGLLFGVFFAWQILLGWEKDAAMWEQECQRLRDQIKQSARPLPANRMRSERRWFSVN